MYDRIVVPLDGSEVAEKALAHAKTLADALHLPLHLIRVVDISPFSLADAGVVGMPSPGSSPPGVAVMIDTVATLQDEATQYLESRRQHLDVGGRRVTFEVRSGPSVADELVEAVIPSNLLVMTTHGRTGLSRWFMGSVAEGVMRRSPAPVLIIRVYSEHDGRATQNGA